ncbi:MAG: hypothetical protein J6M02_03925 [Clostridia bacterium]|nr:hypothetical protein [Clostridia bacterium]
MKRIVLKRIVQIDAEFVKRYGDDPNVLSVFVVGSMADRRNYKARQNNDYDIRIVVKEVTPALLDDFEEMLRATCKRLSDSKICVGYSTLVAPANHCLSEDKCNILIHALIHAESDLRGFLPVTHQYTYGKLYRIVSGEDCLAQFKDVRYTLEELRTCHEGLLYCIDMLEKKEYRYLCWEKNGETCDFVYHADPLPKDVENESCFYSVNKFLWNLYNYCRFSGYTVPEERYAFAKKFLGNADAFTVFFLRYLVAKDDFAVEALTDDVIKETLNVLYVFRERIEETEKIFGK